MNQLDQQYQRMIDGINSMQALYGELVTYRAARGCLAIDMPLSLVAKVNESMGVKRDIALQTLAGLLVPQLDLVRPKIMQDALGDAYTGKRGDYLTLVTNACNELKAETTL
ncbi:hypothetical protein HLB35_15855 [Halomonas sp. TBZ9]|uniref:Uncharacterized protein n=1 Tax=Vreelandella azerica TaxID=2732867 RepID=A0A7Y3U272_9GAMM|nr:hypothetical protein [Halomonas azerica]NOG32869.1 hypothetical protein [Halomonas azerica]